MSLYKTVVRGLTGSFTATCLAYDYHYAVVLQTMQQFCSYTRSLFSINVVLDHNTYCV
jgi:hypothetical protein